MFPCDLLRVWCFQCHFHQSLLTFRPKEHFKKKKESICLFRDLEDAGSLTLRDPPLHLRCWMVPSSPPCGRVPTNHTEPEQGRHESSHISERASPFLSQCQSLRSWFRGQSTGSLLHTPLMIKHPGSQREQCIYLYWWGTETRGPQYKCNKGKRHGLFVLFWTPRLKKKKEWTEINFYQFSKSKIYHCNVQSR